MSHIIPYTKCQDISKAFKTGLSKRETQFLKCSDLGTLHISTLRMYVQCVLHRWSAVEISAHIETDQMKLPFQDAKQISYTIIKLKQNPDGAADHCIISELSWK